jgi:hypothetical protein
VSVPAYHGSAHSPIGADPTLVERWHNIGETGEPAFLGTWVNSAPTIDVPNPVPMRFRLNVGMPNLLDQDGNIFEYRDHELVLQGDIEGDADGTPVFVLPPEYRYAHDLPVHSHDSAGLYVPCRLLSDGTYIRGLA